MMPCPPTAVDAPPFAVIEFTFSHSNTDCHLIVMCNGGRFLIRLSADNFSDCPRLKEQYLFHLRAVAEDEEGDGSTEEDFYDWVLEPFLPLFRDTSAPSPGTKTLQDYVFPETLRYTLYAVTGALTPLLTDTL